MEAATKRSPFVLCIPCHRFTLTPRHPSWFWFILAY